MNDIMKQTCSNCANSRPTYKGRYCVEGKKQRMVKLSGTCEKWRPKR
jgi:hypothetical protein